MRELRTEIEIDASPTKVWRILTDLDSWKDWNPIVHEAGGQVSQGAQLSMTMTGKDGKEGQKYMPIITKLNEPRSFHWRAKMMAGFLFTNDKVLELEEVGSGTRLVHIEKFGGILVSMFWNKLNKGVVPMLNSMNNALKIKIEKG